MLNGVEWRNADSVYPKPLYSCFLRQPCYVKIAFQCKLPIIFAAISQQFDYDFVAIRGKRVGFEQKPYLYTNFTCAVLLPQQSRGQTTRNSQRKSPLVYTGHVKLLLVLNQNRSRNRVKNYLCKQSLT